MVLSTSRARDKTEVEGSHFCVVSTFKLFEGQEKLPQKVDDARNSLTRGQKVERE